eukprot:Opistho-2@65772
MASPLEQQAEELEVLRSIYGDDPNFKELSPNSLGFMITPPEDADKGDAARTVYLEVTWPPLYPDEVPVLSLNAFFNKDIRGEAKKAMVDALTKQAVDNIGVQMTYTLVDWLKEHLDGLLDGAYALPAVSNETKATAAAETPAHDDHETTKDAAAKKEKLSKRQKAKLADRIDAQGHLQRGFDWVDLVKHLLRV